MTDPRRFPHPPRAKWPRALCLKSLAGQLIASLLVALVLAQVLTFAIFASERHEAFIEARRDQVIQRAASLVRMLEHVPERRDDGLTRAILTTATSGRVRFWIANDSLVPATDAAFRDNGLARALAGRLERATQPAVLVEVREDAVRPGIRLSGLLDRLRDGWQAPPPPHPGARPAALTGAGLRIVPQGFADHDLGDRIRYPVGMAISVALSDGTWLNGEMGALTPRGWGGRAMLALVLMAATICAVTFLVVRRLTRPLADLAAAADALGRGEPVAPLEPRGPEEVRRTTDAFNRMQERLHRFVADRTRMLAAISHDLRTPLTSLRLRAEFITDDAENKQKILETLDEMTRITEATLAFARDEFNQGVAEETDLAALAQSVAAELREHGHAAEAAAGPPAPLTCHPVALKRALRNLAENAVTHGGRADIRLERAEGEIRIVVEDDGPGIPEGELENVFEPFHRLETSRSQDTGGVGLGLAIARTIARAHGGDITLANRPQGGLAATLHLPLPEGGR